MASNDRLTRSTFLKKERGRRHSDPRRLPVGHVARCRPGAPRPSQ
jgi:hypothetical protein